MRTVRIKGLVGIANQVRSDLSRGVTPQRKRELEELSLQSLAHVNAILRRNGVLLPHLAAPSRRAYAFLAGIKWDEVREDENATGPAAGVRWTGLGGTAERLMARLNATPGANEIKEIGQSISQLSRRIEQSIQRAKALPEQLTAATRDWRGWFAWLSDPESLAQYLGAIDRVRSVMEPVAIAAGKGPTMIFQFRPSRHIYKMHSRGGLTTIAFPTAMTRFDSVEFRQLAELIFNPRRDSKGKVVELMRGESYVDLATELEALAGIVEGTRGAFHDLADVFDRVNAQFFEGAMARPRLTWSRSFTGRKFGHYDHVKDWVMISSTLDQSAVPAFVVEYLMFHELLHKKHGVRWVNGRGMAHTAAFYADEKRFPRYDEAEGWINKLARG